MIKILCFGDSNTYGYIPQNGERYDKNTRWTGILQSLLGNEYLIINRGCNNRTCAQKNPFGKLYTGIEILPDYLENDLDFVILFIGTNDIQFSYNAKLSDLKCGMENLINMIHKNSPSAKIILLSPPNINENILTSHFSTMFDQISVQKSLQISEIYEKIAKEQICDFYDLNKIVTVSTVDGLHLEPQEHRKLAEYLANVIKT